MKRPVTSIDWSQKVSLLIFVSKNKNNEYRSDEPDRLSNIFSLNLKTRPEITLIC